MKADLVGEYAVRKLVESFIRMRGPDPEADAADAASAAADPNVQYVPKGLRVQNIRTKKDLYDYFSKDFSQIFFTPLTYIQEQMIVVGPTRFRSVHT
jgi:hypothetical protein